MHVHNVGRTLVRQLPEQYQFLVTSSAEEYTDTAIALAMDVPRLVALREGLRPAMLASRLCDGRRYAADVEVMYGNMWRAHCAEREAS
jgi:predicted O-linked N-acetylglucosamine transferase (SPINDLY family)